MAYFKNMMSAPDPLRAIKDHYAAKNAERKASPTPWGVIRGSSIGDQPRKQILARSNGEYPPEDKTDRAFRTFEVGDQRHDALRFALVAGIKKAFAGYDTTRIPVTREQEEEWEIDLGVPCSTMPGKNWRVVGHPDGVMPAIVWKGILYERVLLEIKTTSSFGWKDIQAGLVDAKYVDQAQLYMFAADLKFVLFLYERKDTQHLDGVVMPADPARQTFLLEQAAYCARQIERGVQPLAIPLCEGESYGWESAKAKVGTRFVTYQALGWKCSYCDFAQHCYPNHVRIMIGGKPKCVPLDQTPSDAVVVAHGTGVTPREGWKMVGAEDDES